MEEVAPEEEEVDGVEVGGDEDFFEGEKRIVTADGIGLSKAQVTVGGEEETESGGSRRTEKGEGGSRDRGGEGE